MNAKPKRRRRFNRSAREMLMLFVRMKDRLRALRPSVPYHREGEHLGVLGIVDSMINAVIDDQDVDDYTAAAWLNCISLFVASLSWPEAADTWEEA